VLGERAVRGVGDAGRHDVDVVSAGGEAGGEALGEAGGAVDIGGEGVGGNDDRQRTGVSERIVGRRLGFGHGMRGQSVRRRNAVAGAPPRGYPRACDNPGSVTRAPVTGRPHRPYLRLSSTSTGWWSDPSGPT